MFYLIKLIKRLWNLNHRKFVVLLENQLDIILCHYVVRKIFMVNSETLAGLCSFRLRTNCRARLDSIVCGFSMVNTLSSQFSGHPTWGFTGCHGDMTDYRGNVTRQIVKTHKMNSLVCCEVNSEEFGGGLFIILLCCHLMAVVHVVNIWQEFDTVNSKYDGKWATMPNMGSPACNGL